MISCSHNGAREIAANCHRDESLRCWNFQGLAIQIERAPSIDSDIRLGICSLAFCRKLPKTPAITTIASRKPDPNEPCDSLQLWGLNKNSKSRAIQKIAESADGNNQSSA